MSQKPLMTTSQFYFWRTLVAVAWVDGTVDSTEISYFKKVFDNLMAHYALTETQRNALADDLLTAKKQSELYSYINDPDTRAELLNFVENVVMLDGVVDPQESQLVDKLKAWHYPNYDADELRKEIRDFREQSRQGRLHEQAQMTESARSRNPFFAAVDASLGRFGIRILGDD